MNAELRLVCSLRRAGAGTAAGGAAGAGVGGAPAGTISAGASRTASVIGTRWPSAAAASSEIRSAKRSLTHWSTKRFGASNR